MKLHILTFATLLFLFMLPIGAQQSSISGKWKWEDASGGQSIVLELKASGSTLSGTITMAQASLKMDPNSNSDYYLDPDSALNNMRALFFPPVAFRINDGRIDGSTISFTQISRNAASAAAPGFGGRGAASAVSGNEKLIYSGQVDGDKIHFTREYRPNPGGHLVIGTHVVAFTVVRVQ